MIDANKCEFEESFRTDGGVVHYFIYPKDLGEVRFHFDDEYNENDIVSMCISLTVDEEGNYYMQISPTVDEDDALLDIDWQDLHLGHNYTEDTVNILLDKVQRYKVLSNLMSCRLEDDDTPNGGVAFKGETVRDFIRSTDRVIRDLDTLNAALKECGIRQLCI